MTEEFENAKKWVEENEVCRFEGEIDRDKIKAILVEVDNYMISKNTISALRRYALNTFVEVLQNLIKNIDYQDFNKKTIVIGELNNEYKIFGRGVIKNDFIEVKKLPIDYLNENIDNRELLKNLYKNVIKNLPIPVTYIGLGFIDIVRKSKNKILYDFEPIDSEYSYFSLIVRCR
ncbi:MAG: DUF6272 family protein [Thermoflexibacter sp.]|jgi:hypothetical protein|nr:DUF6272 family protein [Thermoflexibacter sp.]